MESLPPSSSNLKAIIDSGERNWLDLPRDAVLSIFQKLHTIDILIRAHNVCITWRKISKDPFLYRTIDMTDLRRTKWSHAEILCYRAIDYSCGNLIDINIKYFATNNLLRRIANNASHLRRLRLACCWRVTDEVWCEVAEKFSHLEELHIYISRRPLKAIGRCCPRLKTLKFQIEMYKYPLDDAEKAFYIVQTIYGLHHLQLFRKDN